MTRDTVCPSRCEILLDSGHRCSKPGAAGAPLNVCEDHLIVAADWVGCAYGVTDVLPSPCRACGARLGMKYPSGWLCAVCEWRVDDIPDYDLAPIRVDVVYYIRFGDRIKIGTSATPRRRLASLPCDELLAFERGDRLVEHRRHLQFAQHRIPRTEWFEGNDALSRHIAEISAGVADPWAQYARWVSQTIALSG